MKRIGLLFAVLLVLILVTAVFAGGTETVIFEGFNQAKVFQQAADHLATCGCTAVSGNLDTRLDTFKLTLLVTH